MWSFLFLISYFFCCCWQEVLFVLVFLFGFTTTQGLVLFIINRNSIFCLCVQFCWGVFVIVWGACEVNIIITVCCQLIGYCTPLVRAPFEVGLHFLVWFVSCCDFLLCIGIVFWQGALYFVCTTLLRSKVTEQLEYWIGCYKNMRIG